MQKRSSIAVLGIWCVFAAGACAAATDPSNGTTAPAAATTGTAIAPAPGDPAVDPDSGAPPASDPAAPAATDSAAPVATTPAPGAFDGAPAFTPCKTLVNTALVPAHVLAGGVDGKDCLSCHSSGAVTFLAGGTVFSDAAGTTPAANVEVRLVGASGAELGTACTDTHGNAWIAAKDGVSVAGTVGVRDATHTQSMTTPLTNGGCNACHDGTTTARIHL